MKSQNTIVKFDYSSLREKYGIHTLQGTVPATSIIQLIDNADLNANPREAKLGKVTSEIIESICDSPELFHFKSKGLLVSCRSCEPLERNRFKLSFEDPDFEGILDGGHNLLAIAVHIINLALEQDSFPLLRGKKRWDEVKKLWDNYRDEINEVKDQLDFFVPVEILFPREGAQGLDSFENSILEIAQARNNNAELTLETKANKKGLYDAVKEALDPEIEKQVEWKTNDGGRIKARDIIALSLIPLSKIEEGLPGISEFRPVSLYRNKGACIANFDKLMTSDVVSRKLKGDIRELKHEGIKSAISLLHDIPKLVDKITEMLPEAYNSVSPGFGRITAVRMYDENKVGTNPSKYLRKPPKTKYYQKEVVYDVPEGFVLPVVWGLSEVMYYSNGVVDWKQDPFDFLDQNLSAILKVYQGIISLSNFDPQSVAKVAASYELVGSQVKALVKN